MPRIRQNITTGEWIILAPGRAKRPNSFAERPFSSTVLHADRCEFCHGQDAWKNRDASASTPHIYVLPNKFPAFSADDTLEETGHGFYTDDASLGRHEVLVLLDPRDTLYAMSAHRLGELLHLMQQRTHIFEKDSSINSFIPIYNQGREGGASVAHPHAQFFASAIVAPRLAREFFVSEQYHTEHGRCLFCQMNQFELKEHTRIVAKNDGAVAFAAYAPRFPFETWIVPEHHAAAFSKSPERDIHAVAEVLHTVLHQFNKKLAQPPLNWYIHTARSLDHHLQPSYHWHLEITPRLSMYGGYELASDMNIETVTPEVAAEFLKP